MAIVEEAPDRVGRWFAAYNDDGTELFSARFVSVMNELQVAWTTDIRLTSTRVAEIQALIGCSISTFTGAASNGLEQAIESGRLNTNLQAAHLSRVVGGNWTIEIARREGNSEIWDIAANREQEED